MTLTVCKFDLANGVGEGVGALPYLKDADAVRGTKMLCCVV